jgi:hypothetical protein
MLTASGPEDGTQLRRRLGVSQSVFSRIAASVADDLLVVGKTRAARYAARRTVPRVGTRLGIYEIDEHATTRRIGTLHAQGTTGFFVEAESEDVDSRFYGDLPYFLDGMRPAGFLGRAVPRQHPELELPDDVRLWSGDQCLIYLSRHGWDLSGNLIVGEEAFRLLLESVQTPRPSVAREDRAREYPRLAASAIAGGNPGSSAVGEQPKFLTRRDAGVDVLVKFSPPVTDLTTRRTADLLVCEHLVHRVLTEHGQPAVKSELISAENRVFLEVERFDRFPGGGRRGVISLQALDAEFVGSLRTWRESAEALANRRIIDVETRDAIRMLGIFGGLIANSDMHPGNLSFFTRGTRVLGLTPSYDMLPMRYAARDGHGMDAEFEPPLPTPGDASMFRIARKAATELWERASNHEQISTEFRAIAASNLAKLRALAEVERRLP